VGFRYFQLGASASKKNPPALANRRAKHLGAKYWGLAPSKTAFQRSSRRSTRLRLLPTFLTAFFTAAFDRPVFFDSYPTS
jgi:hypothetical protein